MDRTISFGSNAAGGRLPTLDGLRACAVAVVVAYHAHGWHGGDVGVTLFFVLSGFLITWLLFAEYRDRGTVSLRAFYVRRTLRIVPAYLAFLIGSWVVDHAFGHPWPDRLALAAVTYTVNYWNVAYAHHAPTIGHAWSLAIEEQFYLCWPLLFIWLIRRSTAAAMWGVGSAVLVVCAWRSVGYAILGLGQTYAYNAFESRADALGIGCLLALIAANGVIHGRAARWLTTSPWLPCVTVFLLVRSHDGPAAYHYSIGMTVDALLCAILLLQLVTLSAAWQWRWLDYWPIRFIGAISYPVYLWHLWGLNIGQKFTILTPAERVIVGVAASLALALGSYYFIERPALAFKRGLLRRLAPRAAPSLIG